MHLKWALAFVVMLTNQNMFHCDVKIDKLSRFRNMYDDKNFLPKLGETMLIDCICSSVAGEKCSNASVHIGSTSYSEQEKDHVVVPLNLEMVNGSLTYDCRTIGWTDTLKLKGIFCDDESEICDELKCEGENAQVAKYCLMTDKEPKPKNCKELNNFTKFDCPKHFHSYNKFYLSNDALDDDEWWCTSNTIRYINQFSGDRGLILVEMNNQPLYMYSIGFFNSSIMVSSSFDNSGNKYLNILCHEIFENGEKHTFEDLKKPFYLDSIKSSQLTKFVCTRDKPTKEGAIFFAHNVRLVSDSQVEITVATDSTQVTCKFKYPVSKSKTFKRKLTIHFNSSTISSVNGTSTKVKIAGWGNYTCIGRIQLKYCSPFFQASSESQRSMMVNRPPKGFFLTTLISARRGIATNLDDGGIAGGVIAAIIIVLLLLIGGGVGGFILYKKKHAEHGVSSMHSHEKDENIQLHDVGNKSNGGKEKNKKHAKSGGQSVDKQTTNAGKTIVAKKGKGETEISLGAWKFPKSSKSMTLSLPPLENESALLAAFQKQKDTKR